MGVPGLLVAVADGGVVLANAHGSGVLEDVALASAWAAAASSLGTPLAPERLDATGRRTGLAEVPVFRAAS